MTSFKKNIPETDIQFAYTVADGNTKNVFDGYKSFIAQTGKISLPMIVYIDKNNKVQVVEWGRSFEGEHLKKILQSMN